MRKSTSAIGVFRSLVSTMGNDESTLQQSYGNGNGKGHLNVHRRGTPPSSPRNSKKKQKQVFSNGRLFSSSPAELLFRRLHAASTVPFDPDNDSGHMLLLKQTWSHFNKDEVFKREGKEWQAIGFQSPDPVS